LDGHFGGVRRLVASEAGHLNVLEVGESGRPVVVFVHGFPDTHAVWLPTIARLVDDDLTVDRIEIGDNVVAGFATN